MKRCNRNWMAGVLLGAVIGLPGLAEAGPYVNLMQPCDCPPTHYSAFHVLTPAFYRWAAFCQGPCKYIFAQNTNPDVPPVPYITKYHCPAVNPMQFSMVNYPGLDGNIPASTYPVQQQPTGPGLPKESPPQQLAPPRIEKAPELLPQPREEPEKK